MNNYSVEEKTCDLLIEIDEKRLITATDDLISIPFNGSRLFNNVETQIILGKFEKDYQIISINRISDGNNNAWLKTKSSWTHIYSYR